MLYAASQGSVQFPSVRSSNIPEMSSCKKARSVSRAPTTKHYFQVPFLHGVGNTLARSLIRREQSDEEDWSVTSPFNRGWSIIRVNNNIMLSVSWFDFRRPFLDGCSLPYLFLLVTVQLNFEEVSFIDVSAVDVRKQLPPNGCYVKAVMSRGTA